MQEEKRLSKALAAAGIASRRASEEMIFEGRVKVNGKKILLPQTLVNFKKDIIIVDGQQILDEEKRVYFLLNKPKGCICSSKPVGTKKLVVDLFVGQSERLFTVGRLDRDTTGLILVTNDGHFCNEVIHPSKRISKEYLVKTGQEINANHLKTISEGVYIDDILVKPTRVQKVRKGTLKITVMEGMKHEVRLLVKKAALDLHSLSRIRIGGLHLGPLKEGTFRHLTEEERASIF